MGAAHARRVRLEPAPAVRLSIPLVTATWSSEARFRHCKKVFPLEEPLPRARLLKSLDQQHPETFASLVREPEHPRER
jgi:hypothetical protein